MKIYPIETGNFKLDGGAMFGVVPKVIWNKTNPADQNNQIELAARSLLIEDGNRLLLIDTGMGNKQSDKFFGYYALWGNFNLNESLKQYGFTTDDITDVFLTHLHFDHCGGAISLNEKTNILEPTFKNAKYWSNKKHWDWAIKPNKREKASFLNENILPIEQSGQLNFIPTPNKNSISFLEHTPLESIGIWFVNGHTEKQMLPQIRYKNHTIVFCADLIPTLGHLPLPYVMGYDTRPLITVEEKELFLNTAAKENFILFLEHDPYNTFITVKQTERGIRLDQKINQKDFITI